MTTLFYDAIWSHNTHWVVALLSLNTSGTLQCPTRHLNCFSSSYFLSQAMSYWPFTKYTCLWFRKVLWRSYVIKNVVREQNPVTIEMIKWHWISMMSFRCAKWPPKYRHHLLKDITFWTSKFSSQHPLTPPRRLYRRIWSTLYPYPLI